MHATELETAKAALRAGADYLVHSVSSAPVDAEFIRLAREPCAAVSDLFVVQGYEYALSNRWQATPEEQRLADPQILAAMHDLDLCEGSFRHASPNRWRLRLRRLRLPSNLKISSCFGRPVFLS